MKMKINYKELCVITYCPICGHAHEIEVNEDDYDDWKDGVLLAQDAFPYLPSDEREMLISGICPTCWDGMFGFGDNEDEEVDEEDYADDCDSWDAEVGFDPYEGCYTFDC